MENAVPTRAAGGEVVTLSIDLQEGFLDDTVVLQVNGEEVFRREHVSTKLLLGIADSSKAEVEKGPAIIEVNVETKDIQKTISLELSADTYLGISIANGMIEHIVSNKPFGYGWVSSDTGNFVEDIANEATFIFQDTVQQLNALNLASVPISETI